METRDRRWGARGAVFAAGLMLGVVGAQSADSERSFVNAGIIQALNSITGWRMDVGWGWVPPIDPERPGAVTATFSPLEGLVKNVDFVPPIDPEVPPVDPERPAVRVTDHPPDPGRTFVVQVFDTAQVVVLGANGRALCDATGGSTAP